MLASKPYQFHPAAWDEFEAADHWDAQRSPDASEAFLLAVEEALASITESPRRWPLYLHGTRRFVLQRFPFSVIYLDEPDFVQIIAVAHGKRRPGYWKRRV